MASRAIDIGLSDGHSMITIAAKKHRKYVPAKTITYRSFKTFDATKFRTDLQSVPFSVCDTFSDPGDSLWAQQHLMCEILNEHAPMKQKRVRGTKPPYLNRLLRKNIMEKSCLRNRYIKSKTSRNWEIYKIQCNKTMQIR